MEPDSEKRLSAIEQRLAELTSRIYRLEQLLDPNAPSDVGVESRLAEGTPADPQLRGFPFPPSELAFTAAGVQDGQPLGDEPADSLNASRPSFTASNPVSPKFAPSSDAQPSRSLESLVGGQWLNRLGILAVLVGVSYFLKLAFDNDWIGPGARILIGLLCGIGLLLWSERFRSHGFAVFAYSLKAIALGTLYLSLWASSQFYHLVPPWLAFAGMVGVTLTSAALALLQNSELLAAGALLGGFLTPILVSSGQNQEVALLLYLFLLDVGIFWVVSLRRWPRLLPAAFVGTALLSAGWASVFYNESELVATLLFATLFFLLFAMAPLVERLDATSGAPQRHMQTALIIANALAYCGAAFAMLAVNHRDPLAWCLFTVAAFYFGLQRLLQWRRLSSIALDSLLLCLVIAFITVAVPVANVGRWITFAWDIEAAVIFWLAYHKTDRLLRMAGGIVLLLAVLRLVTEGYLAYTPLFNPRFALYVLTIAVAAMLAWASLRLNGEESWKWAGAAVILVNLLALAAMTLELQDYFAGVRSVPGNLYSHAIHIEEAFSYSALWIIYGAGLITVGFLKREAFLRWQGIVLLCAAALKVFFFDISALQRGYRIAAFIVLGVVLLGVSFFYQRMRTGEAR